jgi:hypothetical protein
MVDNIIQERIIQDLIYGLESNKHNETNNFIEQYGIYKHAEPDSPVPDLDCTYKTIEALTVVISKLKGILTQDEPVEVDPDKVIKTVPVFRSNRFHEILSR